ncbi:MAG: N-6 DNA methylase [Bacteroidota bacterium]|nr:N-6 DNA methylase [Flavobacteriales bacterium]MDQ3193090.1 N-6 DNA methylase [Bacteroidota bacterium]
METKMNIEPLLNELPADYADRLGVIYTSKVTKEHKKENGQYFTPVEISRFMGELAGESGKTIKILDPGCGIGILSCALIEKLIIKFNIEKIELTVYETDSNVLPYTEATLNYLNTWLKTKNICLEKKILTDDFILANAAALEDSNISLFGEITFNKFDFIISNPPYFKLSKEDKRTKAAEKLVSGQPNIYAFFMGISARLLNETGQLIFITPRSFASGNYFRTFRKYFFLNTTIQQIHLFVSRKDTFNRDSVLQETMILKAIKSKKEIKNESKIIISSSFGMLDLSEPKIKLYNQSELIDLTSTEKILHLPTTDYEEEIVNLFKSWKHKLKDFGIQISTGPVVAFRAKTFIRESFENGTVFLAPLYWLHNVLKMNTEWPIHKTGKGQYILICPESKSLLIPNNNYVLLRRFSSKDDKSRLVAAPYFPKPLDSEFLGVENKVNYIYRPKGVLEKNEVMGISALLNSKHFDTYFRTFNGNVNVSATELREMPLPPLEIIKEIGNKIILNNIVSQTEIDDIIFHYFSISDLSIVI